MASETTNLKRVISGNDADGPRLPTNAVIVTQDVFGSGDLLSTTQLALTSGFNVLQAYKAALAFSFVFELNLEAEIRTRRMRIFTSFVASLTKDMLTSVTCNAWRRSKRRNCSAAGRATSEEQFFAKSWLIRPKCGAAVTRAPAAAVFGTFIMDREAGAPPTSDCSIICVHHAVQGG